MNILSKPPEVTPFHGKLSIVEIVLPLALFYAATEPAMYMSTNVRYAY